MKMWRCSQCGNTVRKGFFRSLAGPPEECAACGNAEFDDPLVEGTVHRTLDRFVGGA
jgi:hypothetical protein